QSIIFRNPKSKKSYKILRSKRMQAPKTALSTAGKQLTFPFKAVMSAGLMRVFHYFVSYNIQKLCQTLRFARCLAGIGHVFIRFALFRQIRRASADPHVLLKEFCRCFCIQRQRVNIKGAYSVAKGTKQNVVQ
ncbi:MAG: hypothetical protein QW744_05920, partial [Candidatus Bathyarchaeia archaeon]